MTSRYSSLKQQAQIYQTITGKKCSIFHNTEPSQSTLIKLPSAVKNRVISEGPDPFKRDASQRHNWNYRRKYDNSRVQGRDLYQIILKQGINMALTQESPTFASKAINHRNKTSQIRKKLSFNPEKETQIRFQSLHNQNSLNKFDISNRKIEKLQFKTASTPSFINHEASSGKLEANPHKKTTNFLLVNKSSIAKSDKKSRTKSIQQNMTRGLMGKSKKERLQLQKMNRQQSRLQQQLKHYHEETKKMINEMKTKHNLNFSKIKRYLRKIKNQHTPPPVQTEQDNILFKQAIQSDKISEQISHLNFYLKENKARLKNYEDYIDNNSFYQHLESDGINQLSETIEQKPQQNGQTQSYHQKISIIDNLRASLINLRLKNEEQQRARQKAPLKVHERLRQLLLQ